MKIRKIICLLLSLISLVIVSCKEKKAKQTDTVQKPNTTNAGADSIIILNDRGDFSQIETLSLDTFILDGQDTLNLTLISIADPRDTITISQKYINEDGLNIQEIAHTINYKWQLNVMKNGKQIMSSVFTKYDFIDTSEYSDPVYYFSNLHFISYNQFNRLLLFDYWFAPDGSDYGPMKTFVVNMKGQIMFIKFSGMSASCGCDVTASFSENGKYLLMCKELFEIADQYNGKEFPEKKATIVNMGWINNDLFGVLFDTDGIENEINNFQIYDTQPHGVGMFSFNAFDCELGYTSNIHNDMDLPFVHLYDNTNETVILLNRENKPLVKKIPLEEIHQDQALEQNMVNCWEYYFENYCMVWAYDSVANQLHYNIIDMSLQ